MTGVVTETAAAQALGEALAQELRAQGATAILAQVGRG